MPDLLADYAAGVPALLENYAAPPDALLDAVPNAREWDPDLVGAIRAYNKRLGASPAFSGNEAVIVTGQQPALFAGPLYTVYKAISTLQISAEITRRHGVPCIPVFWVGSEDHDFDEARAVHYLTRKHDVAAVEYKPVPPPNGLPMYRVVLDSGLHAEIDRMARETPGSEHAPEVARFLHDALDASESLADWSARILARLFADTPLVFFAPHLPEARRLNASLLAAEIADPLATSRIVNGGGTHLESLGYGAQVLKGPYDCNFFLEVAGRRRKVEYRDGRFHVPEERTAHATADLEAILAAEPERFSTNVALRCIVQQRLFPTAAYVAGPGELAYWGQLKPLFEHHNVPMPIVYPRLRALLLDPKSRNLLNRFGLRADDFGAHPDILLDCAREAVYRGPDLDELETARRALHDSLTQTRTNLRPGSPTAAKMMESLDADIERKFAAIRRTLLHEADGREQTVSHQIQRLCNTIQPLRKPQERVFTICALLFEHGWNLVPRLTRELDAHRFDLQEIEL